MGFSLMKKIIYFTIVALLFSGFSRIIGQEVAIPPQHVTSPPGNQAIPPKISQQASPELSIFGHNLFALPEGLRREAMGGGMMFPGNYRLGTGDRLAIYLLGKIQQNFDVIVNVEGKIFIPTVGVFYVADLTISEFQTFLEKRLAKYYDNFSLSLMLIEPKHIPVMVVGDVNRPGKYFLNALNTVLDAVILAGGPTSNGSLRNIQVHRQDRLIITIDLYQFLMKGDFQSEMFLQQYDKILVPLIEDIVTINGEVKRQAKFELRLGGNERLSDLIYLAGGFKDLAYLDRIEISRMRANGEREVFYVDYNEILESDSCQSNFLLKNNDRVHVFSILEQTHPKYVYIHGEVKLPGKYSLEENLHVRDLILKAGNLTRSAYILECEVAKIDPKTPTRFNKINLQEILTNSQSRDNILLEEDDRLFIRQIPEWEVGLTIEVTGEVQFPGKYAITKDSTTLGEIIEKAGGFTAEALIRDASLIRRSSKITIDKEFERLKQLTRDQLSDTEYQYLVMRQNSQDIGQIVVDFYKLCIRKDKSEDVILEDGDIINVPRAPRVVYVTGRIGKPGGILFSPREDIKYYLKKAGGTTWDAKARGIKVVKVTGEIIDDENVKKLEPGDIIWVPRKPDRDWWEFFRQTIAIVAQLATVYIVLDRAVTY
jgi:protein involved in polysaccharide export with SLBB domain